MNFPSSIIKILRCMYYDIAEIIPFIPILLNHPIMKIESVECINPDDPDWEPHSEEEGKKKRDARVVFSPEQINNLEAHYEANAFPKADLREQIGEELGLTAKRVDVWFKNRRAKAKREERGVQKIVKQVKIYSDPCDLST